ncbi:MFS transporter [Bacillus tuaregi]|uniref:MFS transporter n=1 Tax=Bacillus tuaregi TaxID=1816695 RepID=UPI0008F7FEFC|nr:MFS transporter [Bacillus tuaregi]
MYGVVSNRFRFWTLVVTVAVSGFSQGMLTPLIAIIFEQDGIPSSVNGLHATSIYIGMLLAAPFMETPIRKFGYKPMIMTGGIIVITALVLFPVWKSIWFWFILRLLVGIGDNMLHFGSQTWITSFSPEHKRGRNISLYGLFFGLGFAGGPMMARLLEVNEALPFMLSAGLSLLVWLPLWLLRNEFPEKSEEKSSFFDTFSRFGKAWKYGWIAFLFPFCYGFLEASLNGSFPIYALRIGIDAQNVAFILPAFALGSIVFQLPLGMLSDHYGRKSILMVALIIGLTSFTAAGLMKESVMGLAVCFFIAGMLVGSTFSLGVSFMVDLVPKHLLTAGNIMCSILFSIGSISGPFVGGFMMQYVEGINLFFTMSMMLGLVLLALISSKPKVESADLNKTA